MGPAFGNAVAHQMKNVRDFRGFADSRLHHASAERLKCERQRCLIGVLWRSRIETGSSFCCFHVPILAASVLTPPPNNRWGRGTLVWISAPCRPCETAEKVLCCQNALYSVLHLVVRRTFSAGSPCVGGAMTDRLKAASNLPSRFPSPPPGPEGLGGGETCEAP